MQGGFNWVTVVDDNDYVVGIVTVDINGKTVKSTVNGKQASGYKNIILKDKENIGLDVTS